MACETRSIARGSAQSPFLARSAKNRYQEPMGNRHFESSYRQSKKGDWPVTGIHTRIIKNGSHAKARSRKVEANQRFQRIGKRIPQIHSLFWFLDFLRAFARGAYLPLHRREILPKVDILIRAAHFRARSGHLCCVYVCHGGLNRRENVG